MYEDLYIITPTLNERENIEKFILLNKKLYQKAKIVVSDDGSNDGTKETVLRYDGVIFLDRKDNRIHGLTASVLDAIDGCDRDYFIVIDADLQHPVEKIKEIYDKLKQGNDVVIGRRIGIAGKWPAYRRLISKIAVLLGRARLGFNGLKVRDTMSGFFGMKTDLAREIMSNEYYKFELRGYKVLFDFLKYLPKNIKIDEIDYIFDVRREGKSKANSKIGFSYLKSLFK